MRIYSESRVEPAEIDNLGHMNVRVYARKAARGTLNMAAHLGLGFDRLRDMKAVVEIRDVHTRFYREQLEGAPLAVRGGVRQAGPDRIDAYMEMFNRDTGDVAATFNHGFGLFDGAARTPIDMPQDVLDAAEAAAIDWPERGRPRSLPIEPVTPIARAAAQEQGSFVRFPSYTIEAAECDGYGLMDISDAKTVALARMPIKIKLQHRVFDPEVAQRVAIATMESRHVMFRVPRLGEPVVSETRHADVTAKTVVFQHWSYNEQTGEPISLGLQFGLAFDLDKRRSAEFPPKMREALAANRRPDIRDQAAE
ncbi:MAG: acyl-CoA thioesterase [Sphingomonadales bacterium]